MKLQDFIDALYKAGWDSPCDAQHENIIEVYNGVRLRAAEIAYDLGVKAGWQRAKDIQAATMDCKDDADAARRLYALTGDLVAAVKQYRAATGCSLKDAVDAVKGIQP